MKTCQFILVLFLLAVVAGTSFAETIDANSRITAVTIFADRALVTRTATVTLPEGAHEIRITPLPGTIEEDSVTAKGSGEARVKIFGAKFSRKQLTLPQDEKVRALQEQIKQLQDKEKSFQNILDVLQKEREFLASIQAASGGQIGKDLITKQPSAKEVGELFKFLDDSLRANVANAQQAEIEIRKVREEMDRSNRELATLGRGGVKQEFAILVEVESEKAGKFDLAVSYRLPGAAWMSTYEARTDGISDVEWTTYGMIRQWTGENWENVTVTLSTARPSVGARMPEVFPWFLRQWSPPLYPMDRVSAIGGEKKYKENNRLMAKNALSGESEVTSAMPESKPVREEADLAQATVETKGPTVTYQLPKKETISPDGEWKKVPIATQKLPAQFAYEVTSKLSSFAYLRAKVTNHSESFHLAGPVQVFLQGAFVGTSSIQAIAPEEEFDLFLGVDERIKVERKELKDKVDVSLLPGLHGKSKTIDKEHIITLQNFTPKKATIWVHDQVPVSQHDEIKIEEVKQDPKPAEEDKEKPGVFRWKVELPPGQKWTGKLSFRIRHPVEMQVEGL